MCQMCPYLVYGIHGEFEDLADVDAFLVAGGDHGIEARIQGPPEPIQARGMLREPLAQTRRSIG